jgi:hypothetical protein
VPPESAGPRVPVPGPSAARPPVPGPPRPGPATGGPGPTPPVASAPLDAAPAGIDPPAEVAVALAKLDALEGRPVGEHVEVYDEVHRLLQDALASLDEG